MFRSLFDPDSGLMMTFAQITDCIFLSLFFLLGCIPVVTLGASFAALYDASFRAFRQGEKHSWSRFLRIYASNWKGSILPTLVFCALLWADVRAMIALWNAAALGQGSMVLFSAGAFVGVLFLGILSLCFPMLSRFVNPFPVLMKNTVLLALANLPRTLGLGLVNAVAGWLCLRFVFPLFFLPSLAALIGSYLIEPMFKPYMPET